MRQRGQARIGSLCTAIALLLPLSGYAMDDGATLSVHRAEAAIELDGHLDEPDWQRVEAVSDFLQVEPEQGAPPSEQTRVRLLQDATHLYIGIHLQQRNAPIVARQMIQQRDIEGDDQVSVFIDPYRTGRIGYVFTTNPNAVRNEALIVNTDDLDGDWEDIWQVATARTEDGWSAEFAIPFTTLSFHAGDPSWAMNVSRRIAARNEDIALASADRRIDLSTTREVSGFGSIDPGAGIDVVASFSARRARDFEDRVVGTRLEPSLDVFYQITPALTGALTLNTDFSSAEVDQREVNLTRFDLFFPEKRDFFLQDANLFEFADIEENGLPYFSRRVGRGEDGDPLDLTMGVKLSGRVRDVSVGALVVEQALEDSPEQVRLMVARARADLGERHALGGIVTQGDPVSGLADQLYGVDYRYQNDELLDDQELEAFAWWQQVDLRDAGPEDQAWGASLAWPNDRIDARLAYSVIGENFAPPLGFVNRVGIRQLDAELAHRWRPQNSRLRTVDAGFEARWVDDSHGLIESRAIEITPLELRNHAGDEFEVKLKDMHERLDDAFEITDRLLIESGRYDFRRYSVEVQSARQRRWAIETGVEWGDFYDGRLTTLESSLLLSPTPHLGLRLDYEHNRLDLLAGRQTIRLARLSAAFAFNARWSWTHLVQYDSESRELGYNTRLRWEPHAGQELFLILNHGFFRNDFNRFHSDEREVVAKISYVFQF